MSAWADLALFTLTFVLSIVWSVEIGVVVSLIVSLLMVVHRSSKTRLTILVRIRYSKVSHWADTEFNLQSAPTTRYGPLETYR